ncbi:MAG: 3-hydroxyacyl-CoA dehydrogenase family protein [Acidimicrobiia bacterium]
MRRDSPSDLPAVAILGAGTMGPGIAAAFAASGFATSLWARRLAAAETAVEDARRRVTMLVDNRLAEPGERHLEPTDDLAAALDGAELVVEAISEDLDAKRSLFADVEERAGSGALLASTTSGLDVGEIARSAHRPERFVVMHFWNPAHLIPLVEVLGGSDTAPEMVDEACSLVRRLGKHPVRLNKFVPGFLGVRLQQAVVRESVALLEAGVASAEDIDAATRLSFGARFPVIGPLETSDLGGLDVILSIHEYLLADLDCSQSPQTLLRELVGDGHLGVKTGRGFYDWASRDAAELARRRDEELIARVKSLRDRGDLARV